MKLVLMLFLLAVLCWSCSSQQKRSIASRQSCGPVLTKTKEILDSRLSVSSTLASLNQPDVIVISDDHVDEDWNIKLVDILKSIKKENPKLDCLFLEHAKNYQDFLDQFQRNEIGWQEYSTLNSNGDADVLGNDPPEAASPFYTLKKYISQHARSERMKIFAVDAVNTDQVKFLSKLGFTRGYVIERNKIMALTIADLMKKKSCNQALYVVGESHLVMSPKGEENQTLTALLKTHSLSVSSLIYYNEDRMLNDDRSPLNSPICQQEIKELLPQSDFSLLTNNVHYPIGPVSSESDAVPLEYVDESMVNFWIYYNHGP